MKTSQQNKEKILTLLKKHYPNAKISLNFSNNWQLLIAIILSAQCTDKKVNEVTKDLFDKYKKLKIDNKKYKSKFQNIDSDLQEMINYAEIEVRKLQKDIKPTGFYKNKAKHIKKSAQVILDQYDGIIPNSLDKLINLPGVARKTANVFLGNAYQKIEGVAVDTHVKRLSQRLGFTKNKTPIKIEKDLMKIFNKKDWFKITYLLIEHGRKICNAKKPKCDKCFLSKLCPFGLQL